MNTVYLPPEILNYIFEFANPYKTLYSNHVVVHLKARNNYSSLIRQLKRFRIRNRHGDVIHFAKESILHNFKIFIFIF